MDTRKDSATSDIPTFKVARVGNERKRKGGGFSFLRGGGARGVWSGAAGGSGAGANVLGMALSKAMLSILVSSLVGSAAIYYGAHSAGSAATAPKKADIFSHDRDAVKLEGDTTNLPSTANTIPNSLGYLTGSKDGLTPEERAKKEADAAAEAQRIADEEAAKKAEKENKAGAPVDPAAMLASAKADGGNGAKANGFGKKFGSLSSSMGGGSSLSGGSGLSGGVTRQFGGSGGAMNRGTGGQLTAMRGASQASSSKASASRLAASRTKGFARRQLANANAYSRRGSAAGKGETAASEASSAFDNNPGAGTIISGPGISKGTKPQSEVDNAGANEGGPTGGGGNPTVDCGANNYQTADGSCAPIQTPGGADAKPALTMIANVVMGLMVLVGVLAYMAMAADATVFGAATISPGIKTVIGVIGVVIALLGVAMMAMGDYVSGGVATLVGAYVGYNALMPETLTVGQAVVAGIGGAAAMMVGKMLDSGNHKGKAPVAAQQ